MSHLPIIVDPSHATGKRPLVPVMARAALVAGAHGLMVEMHPNPDKALCDGAQSLDPQGFDKLMQQLRRLEEFLAELD
jgi:3-deoxy-7-phosphoheptulonate synthase